MQSTHSVSDEFRKPGDMLKFLERTQNECKFCKFQSVNGEKARRKQTKILK
jgi:hypothetical protein